MLNRRDLCKSTGIGLALLGLSPVVRAWEGATPSLQEVARLPWLCNAVASTEAGRLFAGLPRWPGFEGTPSIIEILPDGQHRPFPGGAWNAWQPGRPTSHALVKVNTIHIFDDDTLWAIDQGEERPGGVVSGQKILQFDTRNGQLLRNIALPADILPLGASLNDLRLDSQHIYLTDSGLGAIIVVNLASGAAVRRLAKHPSTRMIRSRRPIGEGGQVLLKADGSDNQVHSDPIEISPDGQWLYYQALTGPLWRVPTASLRDRSISEDELGKQVQLVHDTGTLTGTAIDSHGNLYLGEYDKPRVSVLAPDGSRRVLVEDERLWNPDAMIINRQRELFIPVPQSARLASNRGPGGQSRVQPPFKIYKLALPAALGNREAVPVMVGKPLMEDHA
ncbi:L-dopachrome tautomerase-related protein [Pseudomonas putida]|uniref:L-dopachrome tautomerase-related protein n=1 Tax=Pseudomonas putida TaxID=303 RepID=UPI00335FE1E9